MSQLAFSASFEYLCYGYTVIIHILLFQCGERLWTSESYVYKRQILTSKVDPCTEIVEQKYIKRNWKWSVTF